MSQAHHVSIIRLARPFLAGLIGLACLQSFAEGNHSQPSGPAPVSVVISIPAAN